MDKSSAIQGPIDVGDHILRALNGYLQEKPTSTLYIVAGQCLALFETIEHAPKPLPPEVLKFRKEIVEFLDKLARAAVATE